MPEAPMIEALGGFPASQLDRLRFSVGAAYRTITETLGLYERMDGPEEVGRLGDVQEWLAEAAALLFGAEIVTEWEQEAKSPEYSPFATVDEED